MISISNYNSGSSSSSSGGVSGISSLQAGVGIQITNVNGPTSTITNTGVLSLDPGQDIQVSDLGNGTWEIGYFPTSPWTLESSSANTLTINCNATNNQYNPAVGAGDQVISAEGTLNSERLVLTTESTTTGGVVVEKNKVSLVVGGTNKNGTDHIIVDDGSISIETSGSMDLTCNSLQAAFDILSISSNATMSLIGDNVVIDGSTVTVQGPVQFSDTPTSSATITNTSDNTNKIPTTSWVQSVYGAGQQKTLVSRTYAGSIVTIPAAVVFVDIVLISRGGQKGVDIGSAFGGTGGGGTTCSLNQMVVREGQKFQLTATDTQTVLAYSIPNSVNPTTFDTMATVPNGGNGGNAGPGVAGNAGTAGSAPTLVNSYGVWTTRYGSAGTAGTILPTPAPTTAGAPSCRPFVADEDGCGEIAGSNRGKAVLYLVYYYI
jgi:hypothetical protein